MLPIIAFAVAAEKTATASYALYLYCAGGAVAGGAALGGGIWLFTPKKPSPRSENDIEIDVELGLQQQKSLELAASILLNVDEQTQTALIQQSEHLEVLGGSIDQLNETLLLAADSATQMQQLIQPLHETAMSAEETVQTMALKLKCAQEQLASVTHELQKTQSALQEKERQLLDSMGQLMTSQEQLTVTSHATRRQLKHLSGEHAAAIRIAHPNIRLNEPTHVEALEKTIEEQARLLQELSNENDALQERVSAHSIDRLHPDSTQQARHSAFTLFSLGR